MAKKKARKKTAARKTTRKKTAKTTTKTTTQKVSRKATQRKVDLATFSEAQLAAALRTKHSETIKDLKVTRARLMRRVDEVDRQIEAAGGYSDSSAPRNDVSQVGKRGPKIGSGKLAAAVLNELRIETTPKELLAKVGHLIGGKNKAAIISQKLMALRAQGRVKNVRRGVWTLK